VERAAADAAWLRRLIMNARWAWQEAAFAACDAVGTSLCLVPLGSGSDELRGLGWVCHLA
jgi:hypothetical protein